VQTMTSSHKIRRMKNFGALLFIIATASRLIAQPIVSESKFVDVDHLKVHYTNYGKGDTALFLFTVGVATKRFGANRRRRWRRRFA
jgi:D-alanyl-lipoteichoic acid acyltransferase DltB (MBOAT superfamily)